MNASVAIAGRILQARRGRANRPHRARSVASRGRPHRADDPIRRVYLDGLSVV